MNGKSGHLLALCGFLLATAPICAQQTPAREPEEESAAVTEAVSGDAAQPAAPAVTGALPAAASADSWFETRLEIEALVEQGDFAAALALGPKLLDLAAGEFGPDSAGVAEAHLLLASVHKENGDYLAAEDDILAAISIYESTEGPLSVTLIEPYIDLGDNYYESGDFNAAMSSYSEARTIGRRAYGLLNEDQIAIIDQMSAAAYQLGDFEEASELQLEALTVIERAYGEFSREALDARYKYASWLREHRLYEDERQQYYQIMRIAERHYEDDPLLQVRALRERAGSFRDQGNGDAIGLAGLRDALEIVRELPEPNPLAEAEVLRDIGDWDVRFTRAGVGRISSVGDAYAEAWQVLGQLENGNEIREEWFEDLVIIYLAPLSQRGLSSEPNAPRGRVVAYFTVDTAGRASDVTITESDPQGFKDAAAIRQIRASVFRPRITNGTPVVARRAVGLDFRYDPAALAEMVRAPADSSGDDEDDREQ